MKCEIVFRLFDLSSSFSSSSVSSSSTSSVESTSSEEEEEERLTSDDSDASADMEADKRLREAQEKALRDAQ